MTIASRKPRLGASYDAKQQAFIDDYDNLLNTMEIDEAVVFVDAVHPTHQVRPVGCWVPKGVAIAVEQTTGRDRLNIHGAINLETGRTQVLDVERVDGPSLIKLLGQVWSAHPGMRRIHVFLDNAAYHRAVIVKQWLARPECKPALRYLRTYCPHLDPIERLWGLMHQNITHNREFKTFYEFRRAVIDFLRYEVPRHWGRFRDRNHRQFPRHPSPIFSGHRLAGGIDLLFRPFGPLPSAVNVCYLRTADGWS